MSFIRYIFFSFIFLTTLIHANPPGHGDVVGTVTDARTGEKLLGVNVFLEHTTIGSATNQDGEYAITNAPAGQYHVVASMIGYEMLHINIAIKPDQEARVDFKLEQTIMEMGAVVVTGTATPHIYEDMPVKTEVIPRKLIEQKQAINLSQALSLQTGVRVETNCSNCNFSQVRILGFDGKYSQVLIDGDPVVSSLAGVYGLDHFPQEMINQIEIVKGGGSALYGGGAVAGTINLITRRPLINQVKIKYQGRSIDGTPDNYLSAVAEVLTESKKSGAYIFGSSRDQGSYDRNNDGFTEIGILKNQNIGFNWYLNPIENGEFIAHVHSLHEDRRGGNKFDLPPHEADIAEWIEHYRWGGTLRWNHRPSPLFDYHAYYSVSSIKRKTFYGGLASDSVEDRLTALTYYGRTKNPTHVTGAQANLNTGHHLLTGGVQYMHDYLNDQTTANSKYYIDETYHNTGFFLQDNVHFFDEEQLEIVFGGRVDKHSHVDDPIFSPRVNIKGQFGDGFTARASFATGFKAPQTFDEDLHIDVLAGDQRIIRNSADLHEEKSRTFNLGLEFQGNVNYVPVLFAITGFHTRLYDAFAQIPKTVDDDGVIVYERVNSDGANVQGVELDLGIRPVTKIELRGGLTYKLNRYDNPVQVLEDAASTKHFMRTPDMYGYSRVSWFATSRLDVFGAMTFTGEAYVPHERVGQIKKSGPYTELELGVTYTVPINTGNSLKLSTGVKNLTDAYQKDLDFGVDRDPYYIYGPSMPRTIYAGFDFIF